MHPSLSKTDHRSWPHPSRPYHWRQSWFDLVFAHWQINAEELRPHIPRTLELDQFDGSAWIGIVPFRMENVMLRGLPNIPGISAFPEINLRTYVVHNGKPGVWFFSLDASNTLAVWAAKRFFHLPYQKATIDFTARKNHYTFSSCRPNGPHRAAFRASYRPASAISYAKPGHLDHWLTERYCLYAAAPDHTLYRGDVHHDPWPLQRAEIDIQQNNLLEPHNLSVTGPPETVHFAKELHVAVWNLEKV